MSKEEKEQRKLERMKRYVSEIPDNYGADQLLQYAAAKMLKCGIEKTIEGMKDRLERVMKESIIDYKDWLKGEGKAQPVKKLGKQLTKKAEKVTVSESDLL